MAEKMFMRVKEIAEVLEVSEPYAYKLVREMNIELKKKGFTTIAGRVSRQFFNEKFYGLSQSEKEA